MPHFILIFLLGFASFASCEGSLPADYLEARALINAKIFEIEAEMPQVEHVVDLEIIQKTRTTPLRIYYPTCNGPLPILLMIHGGGWVAGNLDTHDNMARYLCKNTEALVVSVGYQNSPEGKFPLPLFQCGDALSYIVEHASEYGADPTRIAVIGDSAGGNLAAALTLYLRDQNNTPLNFHVLINPSPDLTCGGTLEPCGDPFDSLRWFASHYVENPEDVYCPYVSPIHATNHSGLPPALILVAEHDELRSDGEHYARKLTAAGVDAKVYVQLGTGHLAGHAARASPKALESLDVAASALKTALKHTSSK